MSETPRELAERIYDAVSRRNAGCPDEEMDLPERIVEADRAATFAAALRLVVEKVKPHDIHPHRIDLQEKHQRNCPRCIMAAEILALLPSDMVAAEAEREKKLIESERQRIREQIIFDQATGAGDYGEAEDYADKIVGKRTPTDR